MRRFLLLLPIGAVIGLVLAEPRANAQAPDEEFGVLKTTPAALPPGIEPVAPRPTPSAPTRPASPPNPFPLTRDSGPWLICAAHYLGFEGADLAQQMALELRNKHGLNAYIFNRGDEERRKQDEEWQQLKAKYPPGTPLRRRGVRIQDQYAVLVGGCKDFAEATALLPRIKALPLPKLTLQGNTNPDKSPYDTMVYSEVDPETKKPILKRAPINPFTNAMVVRNPLLPGVGSNKPKWDPLWKKLNSGEEYSLLTNPKAWTLVVKEYTGFQVIQTGNDANASKGKGLLGSLGLGSVGGESLDRAAAQAHELARFLRDKRIGFESWVLHTRNSSVVTVGGFTGPDDPAMQRVQQQLANLQFKTEQAQADPIGLLRKPIPIEVPRP